MNDILNETLNHTRDEQREVSMEERVRKNVLYAKKPANKSQVLLSRF